MRVIKRGICLENESGKKRGENSKGPSGAGPSFPSKNGGSWSVAVGARWAPTLTRHERLGGRNPRNVGTKGKRWGRRERGRERERWAAAAAAAAVARLEASQESRGQWSNSSASQGNMSNAESLTGAHSGRENKRILGCGNRAAAVVGRSYRHRTLGGRPVFGVCARELSTGSAGMEMVNFHW
jgi:hypothetical protein